MTNFRSISERQEITFIPSRHQALNEAVIRSPHTEGGILPLLALYGANGAGKSNFLVAMHFVRDAVIRSQSDWKPDAKIKFDPHFFHRDAPSTFECQFVVGQSTYRFGFSIDESKVLKEWLFVERRLLYRRTESTFKFGEDFKGSKSIRNFTRKNSLFLSTAAQNNHPLLAKLYAWFSSWDEISESGFAEKAFTTKLLRDPGAKRFLEKAISVIDPRIVAIEPAEVDPPAPPFEVDSKFREALKDYHNWSGITFVHRSSKSDLNARLKLSEESKGTQNYFAIIGSIMVNLGSGGVMILDEAGANLHPMLLRAVVMLFQSPKTNPRNAQLVFSTHDVTLLSPEVLRPDQIWFVERLGEASRYFSLADFRGIRSDLRAQRAYLEGRFGAVPFIEDHLDIFAAELQSEAKG